MSVVSLPRASTWEVGSWFEGCCEEGVERRVFKMKLNPLKNLQTEIKSLENAYNVFSDSTLAKPILLPFSLQAKSRKTSDKKCYLVGPPNVECHWPRFFLMGTRRTLYRIRNDLNPASIPMAGMIPHLDPVMEVLCTRLIQLYGDLGEPKRERCPWLRLNSGGPNDKLKVEGKLTKQGVGIGVRRTNKFYYILIHILNVE